MAKWNADKDIKIFQKTPVMDIDDDGFVTVYSSPPLRSVKITNIPSHSGAVEQSMQVSLTKFPWEK
jgi:hypothetical protein